MRKLIFYFSILFIFSLQIAFAQNNDVIPVIQSGHSECIMFVEWDNNSRLIASVDVNNELVINDFYSGKMFYRTKLPSNELVQSITYDKDNNLLLSTKSENYKFDMPSLSFVKSDKKAVAKNKSESLKIKGAVLKKKGSSLFNKDAYVKFTFAANSLDNSKVVAGDEKGYLYFCDSKLNLVKRVRHHYLDINDLSFSPDGKYLACVSSDRSLSIWNLDNYNLVRRVVPRSFNICSIATHPNDSIIFFGDELGFVYRMEFQKDMLKCESLNSHNGKINDICITSNNQIIGTAGSDNRAGIADFENKKVLQYFTLQPNTSKAKQTFNVKSIQARAAHEGIGSIFYDENVYSVAVSSDLKSIVYSGGKWGLSNPTLKTSSISSLKLNAPKELRKAKKGANLGLGSKDNKHVFRQLYFPNDKEFYGIGETPNKAVSFKTTLTGYAKRSTINASDVFSVGNSIKNNMLLTNFINPQSMSDIYLSKTDLSNNDTYTCVGFEIERKTEGKTIKFIGHRGYITDFEILKSKNYLISSAEDASMCIWDLNTGNKILSVYVVDMGKLIFITPDNYYMAVGDAITGLGFNFEGKVFPAEQFDMRFNRPDYILKAFKVFDKEVIDMYHKAYQKRLSKLNFTEDQLTGLMQLPTVKIANINSIKFKTTEPNAIIKIKANDISYNIDRINIYVNDVPYFGTKGLSVKQLNSKDVEQEITLPLSAGNNLISVSCLNDKGTESLKEELNIYYDKYIKKKPDLYLISLAVADYEQSQYNLRYTIKDGRGFIKLFSNNNNKFFNRIIVDSLYNAQCVRDNFLKLKEKLMQTDVDDYVYVHIAGHGLLDDNLDFYFATSNIDFSNPSHNGLKYDEIEGLLDGIPSRNKLLLMDACHSGEVDKDDNSTETNTAPPTSTPEESSDKNGKRGVVLHSVKNDKKPKTGLNNSFELMRLLFTDLRKGTGTVVISAAAGTGFALENESIENGIFTYCLIEGVNKNRADINKDKRISVNEIKTYIFDGVRKLSNGKQQPTSRKDNLINDFFVK